MTLSAIPPAIRVTVATSTNSRPSNACVSGGCAASASDAGGGALDRVVGRPRPRGVPGAPVERPDGVDVAEAAGVQLARRRLHHHHELGVERLAREQRRERRLLHRQLLAAEEQAAERGAGERQLDHHRERALHVAGAEPVHALAVDPAGPVVLRGDRVEVAGEQQRRVRGPGEHAAVAEVAHRHAARAQHARPRGPRAPPRRATPRGCRSARASAPASRDARSGTGRTIASGRCATAASTSPPSPATSSS